MSNSANTPEAHIIRSWHANARSWTDAVRSQLIESRRLVTDRAVVEGVLGLRPRRVLDVGCGEGWLARALEQRGVEVVGIDVVPHLIAEARRGGGGRFEVHEYSDLAARAFNHGEFAAAVCNFSLLGEHSVEVLVGNIGDYLEPAGHLIVQTLHPMAACGDQPYEDGWRDGSWAGFGAQFSDPAPWFFRTVGSWYAMLRRSGYEVTECREPTARGASAPSSILFICRRRGRAAPLP